MFFDQTLKSKYWLHKHTNKETVRIYRSKTPQINPNKNKKLDYLHATNMKNMNFDQNIHKQNIKVQKHQKLAKKDNMCMYKLITNSFPSSTAASW